jgi:hypothetical protein
VNADTSIIENLNAYIELISTSTEFVKDYPNIDIKRYNKEIFWLFVEIAKIFKNVLLTHEKYYITVGELIQLAVEKYRTNITDLDFETKLEFIYIKMLFKRLDEGSSFNFIIFKDATASALQLLTLVLNVKNKELTKIFNLNSLTTWYDPYTYIINLYVHEKKLKPEYLKYFCRKHLKKTIMTYNYSATLYTCMQGFYDEIKIKNFSSEEKKMITDYFVNFYRFLESLFDDKNLFENSLTELNTKLLGILKKENALTIRLNDDSSAQLQYYIRKERRMNIIDGGGGRTTALF